MRAQSRISSPLPPQPPPPGVSTPTVSPGMQREGNLAGQLPHVALPVAHPVAPRRAVAAAVQAVGREPAAVRLQRDARVVVDRPVSAPHDAVTAAMPARAAGAFADLVALDPQRVGYLQRLDRRVHGVGHVALDAVHAVAAGPAALPAGDGLDVGVGAAVARIDAADADQVHGALAGGGYAVRRELRECLQHGVGDALRGLGVAGADGGRRLGVEEGAGRDLDLDRTQDAGVGGDGRVGEHLDGEEAGRMRHRRDGIDVAAPLRRGAGEVERELVARHVHAQLDDDGLVAAAVVVEAVLARNRCRAAARRCDCACAARHSPESPRSPRQARARRSAAASSPRRRSPMRIAASWALRSPRRSVAVRTLARIRRITSRLQLAARIQPHRRDDDAFLVDLARLAGHGARLHAADVGVMRAGRDVADQRSAPHARARPG